MKCRAHDADAIKICQDLANIQIALKTRGFSHGNDVLTFSRIFLRQHKNVIILENFLHLHGFLERSGIPTFDTRATT